MLVDGIRDVDRIRNKTAGFFSLCEYIFLQRKFYISRTGFDLLFINFVQTFCNNKYVIKICPILKLRIAVGASKFVYRSASVKWRSLAKIVLFVQ
jgi:hypothetical protein